MAFVVLKFGGTSVATAKGWHSIAQRITNRCAEGLTPVVVHSALSGVSNALVDILQLATRDTHHDLVEQVRQQHYALAKALELDGETLVADELATLIKLTAGIALIGEASPRQQARVLALGELMATRIGSAFLTTSGIRLGSVDARDVLKAVHDPAMDDTARYLNANCDTQNKAGARQAFEGFDAYLTQGFIARDSQDDTVVLGRGGSDTSASYFAALLEAQRVEIWTDVAGMYSADPRLVPGARLLKKLDYAEAQEIASTGARVLHPRCIAPARAGAIPLHIRSTLDPTLTGTLVSKQPGSEDARLKAVSARTGITLISMETAGMWQQPGFLARAFAVFARHQISIDLISSSQTSVTVSLDSPPDAVGERGLQALTDELNALARVTIVRRCAAISLVGRRVRAILHELAPAFDVFREFEIHLVSQAANDLNFTFVVDENHSDKLVQRLHELLIHRSRDNDPVMGQAFSQSRTPTASAAPTWWQARRDELVELAPAHEPRWVYDRATLQLGAQALSQLQTIDRLLFSTKANSHPDVLHTLSHSGVDMECVSQRELAHVRDALPKLGAERFLFTPNFAPRSEYANALEQDVLVTIDNRFAFDQWPELFAGRDVLLRVDPGQGQGHHKFVRTAGKQSKFGVPLQDVEATAARAREIGARIVGLHAHKGSGIVDAKTWSKTARTLAQAAATMDDVKLLNLGGGLGVPDTQSDPILDLGALDQHLQDVRRDYPDFSLWLEPGRYLCAAAGVLLTRVTQIKNKDGVRYVGVNTGMNSLIRPALYGAHHHIVNLSRQGDSERELVDIVGPICESADVLGKARMLAPCREGDILLIANAGAYGRVMSSDYNRRSPGDEFVI